MFKISNISFKIMGYLGNKAFNLYSKRSRSWYSLSSKLNIEKKRSSNFALGALGGAFVATVAILALEPFSLSARSRENIILNNAIEKLSITIKPEIIGQLSFSSHNHVLSNIKTTSLVINKGSNLSKTLTSNGIDRYQSHLAINALSKFINPRNILAGQKIIIYHRNDNLFKITIPIDKIKNVSASKINDDKFFSFLDEKELNKKNLSSSGQIDSSLFLAAKKAKLPTQVIMEMIRIFSWDIDFQRDIKPKNKFEVIYENYFDEKGNSIKHGKIIYAGLYINNRWKKLYYFPTNNRYPEYFNVKGESAKKALLKTPVDGARLSSRFGKRRHPILGYTRMHRGIDFAAPYGTPVMAAGDGKIEKAGRNGGYGKYVKIRHKNSYKTAYAHLKSYARGIRPGKYVKQGQIIGYIGSTGVSTGPHLHYEVHKKGKQVNPLSLKLPTGKKLSGKSLTSFANRVDEINNMRIIKQSFAQK